MKTVKNSKVHLAIVVIEEINNSKKELEKFYCQKSSREAHDHDISRVLMSNIQRSSSNRPSPWVRQIITSDGAVLLDIQTGNCVSLGNVAARIWECLTAGKSEDQIIELMASEFDAPADVIRVDLMEFMSQLSKQALVTNIQDKPNRAPYFLLAILRKAHRILSAQLRSQSSTKQLSIWPAVLLLMIYDLFGLRRNFFWTIATLKTWSVSPCEQNFWSREEIKDSIRRACVWYPKRILCLQKSFVSTCLLRTAGLPAVMTIGAQQFPFKAHAWVELTSPADTETNGMYKKFLVWERC